MGIYLGQLPPAEIARLKAELAETLIANFCYPRFFDYRTNELRTRPVDRGKRQEVWLYLSSFDFTAWSRIDLMSPEFQNQVERLLIQFVQRNRSFFGEQGRRRMPDVRMLIGTSSTSIVQGLRSHLTGQKQGKQPFGSPRPVVSWKAPQVDRKPELNWEQVSAPTMLLQQQLQEVRGEVRPTPQTDGKVSTNGAIRRVIPTKPVEKTNSNLHLDEIPQVPTISTPVTHGGSTPSIAPAEISGKQRAAAFNPAASAEPAALSSQLSSLAAANEQISARRRLSEPLTAPVETPAKRKSEPLSSPVRSGASALPPAGRLSASTGVAPAPLTNSVATQMRSLSQTSSPLSEVSSGQREMMTIGEDDTAIFEQMRHQLLVWLRVEAIRAGLEITEQSPSQLMDSLRQQARFDETRLQVVSTLLNLANQVIKTGLVSILDYKQALMFYLMHTRN